MNEKNKTNRMPSIKCTEDWKQNKTLHVFTAVLSKSSQNGNDSGQFFICKMIPRTIESYHFFFVDSPAIFHILLEFSAFYAQQQCNVKRINENEKHEKKKLCSPTFFHQWKWKQKMHTHVSTVSQNSQSWSLIQLNPFSIPLDWILFWALCFPFVFV